MGALKHIALVSLLVGGLAGMLAAPAGAAPEDEMDDISAEIKQQMEKIIRLMHDNESALLELSTGQAARPVRVDVEPPALPPSGQGGRGGEPPEAERARETEKKVRNQQQTGERIPVELEELVRMVPL